MDPRNGGDLLCSQVGVHPVPRLGRREGGAGHGRCPVEVGGGDPQVPLRVPAGRDDEHKQGGARAHLLEDLPSVVGTPGLGQGAGQARVGPAAGRVSGRREGGAPGGPSGERLAHDGVRGGWLGPLYTGLVGRGRLGVSPAPSTNIVTSPTCKSSSGRCRSAGVQFGHSRRVRDPRLVQVRGRVHGVARPQGVQQGRGAGVEGGGRPFAR